MIRPNYSVIDEAIELISSARFMACSEPSSLASVECVIVSDVPESGTLAGLGGIPYSEADDKGITIYDDLRVHWYLGAAREYRESSRYVDDHWPDNSYEVIASKMPEKWKKWASWVENDLIECTMWRCARGDEPSRMVEMYRIYSLGAWPVGWVGDKSNGQFMVVLPGAASGDKNRCQDDLYP